MTQANLEMTVDLSAVAEALDEALDLGLDGEGRWHRGAVSRGLELREGKPTVDREQGIIYGYSVITKGPALGHDMEIDDQTLEQVVSLGNKVAPGIKSRFDHPNASNTSMGTFLGRTKNFRRAGDRVLGDLYLSESAKEAPQGDLYTYVLGLAGRDPQAFGASIVFVGKAEPRLNADGTQKKDDNGKPLPRLARIEQLLASDVVDDPAANPGGLFHRGMDNLATKLTAFLNRWAQHDLLPRLQALKATNKEDSMSTETTPKDQTISPAALDAAKAESHKLGYDHGVKAERERVAGIHKSFAAVWGEQAPASEIKVRDGLIDLGTAVDEAEKHFKTRKLTQITDAAPPSAGGGQDTPSRVDLSTLPLEDRCKAEWDRNEGRVRDEFESLSQYLAFKKAEARGAVKILKK